MLLSPRHGARWLTSSVLLAAACGVPEFDFAGTGSAGAGGAAGSGGQGGGGTSSAGTMAAAGDDSGGQATTGGSAGAAALDRAFTHEGFDVMPGALEGKGSGVGWDSSSKWTVAGASTTDPVVTDLNHPSHPTLDLSNLHANGTMGTSAGRRLDTSFTGPWGDYLFSSGIGKAGREVWISALMRRDASDTSETAMVLHSAADVSALDSPRVSFGYFGDASETSGTKFWSLRLATNVVIGSTELTAEPALLVVRIVFGSPSAVDLFVDPALGTTPETSQASGTLADAKFSVVAYSPGTGSVVDEIRLGPTCAAVTPAAQ